MLVKTSCGSCAFRTQDGKHCKIFNNMPINPDKDYCSKGEKSPEKCDICGGFMIDPPTVDLSENGSTHLLCGNCLQKLGTCSLCDSNGYCDFQENPIKIPPMVQKQVQQGPMIMMTQVQNPERIKATCEKNCGCFDSANGCLRQSGTCNKNKYTYK